MWQCCFVFGVSILIRFSSVSAPGGMQAGRSSLMLATDVAKVEFLLQKGAEMEVKDKVRTFLISSDSSLCCFNPVVTIFHFSLLHLR